MVCRTFHIKEKKSFVPRRQNFWDYRGHPQCLNDVRSYRPCQSRRHAIAYLPESMPFCPVEAEPIWIGMYSCRFPYGYHSRQFWMYWTRRREAAPRTVGSRTKGIRLPTPRQLKKSAVRLCLSLRRCQKPFATCFSVICPKACRKHVPVESTLMAEVGRIRVKSAQLSSIRFSRSPFYGHGIPLLQHIETVCVRKILDRLFYRNAF